MGKEMLKRRKMNKMIRDCHVGERVHLELLIFKLRKKVKLTVCSICDAKLCQESCNKKRYVEKTMYFYDAADFNGDKITIRNPPWSKANLKDLKEMRAYRIIGQMGEPFNNTPDFLAERVEEEIVESRMV